MEIVAGATLRSPGRRIAGAPVHEIQLGIIRSGDPARSAADFPGVGVLRPSLVTLLTAGRDGVAAPELLAGLRIPAVNEAANAELGARDAGDENAIGDQWRDRHRVPFFPFRRLRFPKL